MIEQQAGTAALRDEVMLSAEERARFLLRRTRVAIEAGFLVLVPALGIVPMVRFRGRATADEMAGGRMQVGLRSAMEGETAE